MSMRLFLMLAIALPIAAQVDHGSLNGTVTDASGARVSGAKVVAESRTTGFHWQTQTNSAGAYQLPLLPVGAYKVDISKEGFHTEEYADINLVIGQLTIDAKLTVGQITD